MPPPPVCGAESYTADEESPPSGEGPQAPDLTSRYATETRAMATVPATAASSRCRHLSPRCWRNCGGARCSHGSCVRAGSTRTRPPACTPGRARGSAPTWGPASRSAKVCSASRATAPARRSPNPACATTRNEPRVEVDVGPRCGGAARMRIIGFVTEPAVTKQILAHPARCGIEALAGPWADGAQAGELAIIGMRRQGGRRLGIARIRVPVDPARGTTFQRGSAASSHLSFILGSHPSPAGHHRTMRLLAARSPALVRTRSE